MILSRVYVFRILMNTELRIVIGSDHKGVDLKEAAIEILQGWGYQVDDMGPATKESCNYAEYANKVCKRIVDGRADRGLLICFTGLVDAFIFFIFVILPAGASR